MFPFTKTSKVEELHDRIVWRLLDASSKERPLVLMTALQTGELRLSEACEVLTTVNRIESLSQRVYELQPAIAEPEPYWQQTGRRYIFGV
jgi:hypothetical protein